MLRFKYFVMDSVKSYQCLQDTMNVTGFIELSMKGKCALYCS